MSRAPTMNINHTETRLSKVDPLKYVFRGIFDMLPDSARGHVVAVIGELIGTIFFLFFAFAGGQVAKISSNTNQDGEVNTSVKNATPQQLLYIALAAGFSLTVNAWTFFRISGGLFNPVISLGMALIGAITWVRAALLAVVQTVGAIAASYMVSALFRGGLAVSTELEEGTSIAQGVIIEMILTAQLAFTIFILAAEKHAATFLAPIGIGLSLFIAELIGVFWTGGSLNPARSLGPAIVTRSFPSYHWIYWVGPIAGVIFAVLLYKLVKALEYESVNGDDVRRILLPTPGGCSRKPSSIIPLASICSRGESVRQTSPKEKSIQWERKDGESEASAQRPAVDGKDAEIDGSECHSPVIEQPMLFGYRTFMDAGQMRTEDFIYGRMQSGLRSLRIAASVKSK